LTELICNAANERGEPQALREGELARPEIGVANPVMRPRQGHPNCVFEDAAERSLDTIVFPENGHFTATQAERAGHERLHLLQNRVEADSVHGGL
jgi:hypothetical protein